MEAQEAMSKRDFLKCVRISRKEARESIYWLKVVNQHLPEDCQIMQQHLEKEAIAITSILSAICKKTEANLRL